MTALGPRLEIEVRHGFYADGACPGLLLQPTRATRDCIARSGARIQHTARGLALWLDEGGAADWRDADRDDALAWLLRARDGELANCTAGLGRPRVELSCFDAADAQLDTPTGYWRLHELHWAAAAELRPAATACLDAMPELAAARGDALGLVRVPLGMAASGAQASVRCLIRFAPRETRWKYCLVGEWPEPSLQVVDLAGLVEFEPAPWHALADGRKALAFRSTGPVPLQQRPGERFQLRSRGEGGVRADKVVVKRLPAAAPRHLSREEIDGVPALVSEIFVHR